MTPVVRAARGFTLLEVMITIAIAVVLTLVAVPSFVSFKKNSELTSAANSLLAAANVARTEGMKRNLPTIVSPLGTGWASGWRVFVDVNRSGTFSSNDIVVSTRTALPGYFNVTGTGIAAGNTGYLRFDGSGFSRDTGGTGVAATVAFVRNDLSGSAQLGETRYLVVARTGRVRICKPSVSSDPTCNSASEN
ncbi:prepilin-type N-terminal cleavage/methylation domain-containing protein [Xylophilus sp. Kf1]|nr:prepilin-type N-terminal cleavage/methylation domain-containing protein [Xylophilus sp. Kf1]